ncbi:hypothetical protein OIU77_004799 [Salix suchowensis]|uniref:DUF7865 domain-containing protein n=1 Tax=Salix suchowensis TaxID=1278906 RepID=A0ABQ9AXN3_9ROSI|nr:hypothetical protein OIU77_004799 [Salix suchowensis]
MASSMFFIICILHSAIAITSGSLIMIYLEEISVVGHGTETAQKLLGSTPDDRSLIQILHFLCGFASVCSWAFWCFMVAFVKDREFQSFFAKGCALLHVSMALWRFYFERRVEDLAWDWPKQVAGDFVLALSWVFFIVYTWREKYD